MEDGQSPNEVTSMLADPRAMAWMEEHLGELKLTASSDRLLRTSLLVGFVFGLAAHIGGYALLSSAPGGALGLVADLLHALGWSLWTGTVVAIFAQVIPEAKRRQISHAVDAYEALRRETAEAPIGHKAAPQQRSSPTRTDRRQRRGRQRTPTRKAR
jgi:hypothetical protein